MRVFPETKNYLEYDGFYSRSSCLHVGNLKKGTTKKDLIEYFSVYAPVKYVRIKYYNSRWLNIPYSI